MQENADFLYQSMSELCGGYEAMAADQAREREAVDWCEALAGDCFAAADISNGIAYH
ncbi:hypothetical protein [Terracidiphilus sp.]|jgi:hypothetical protein|uniref:hypothetical protein n=1 Tax=Terracidiphilus sp. TaxID=1964191 RepID=UPI003C148B68